MKIKLLNEKQNCRKFIVKIWYTMMIKKAFNWSSLEKNFLARPIFDLANIKIIKIEN